MTTASHKLIRQATIMKQLSRAVIALEDVSRDGSLLGLSEKEILKAKKAYRDLDKILHRLEQSGIEKDFLKAGLLNE